ncbi:MAG: hypothetical protein V7782_01495 [Psychromonas sp.]
MRNFMAVLIVAIFSTTCGCSSKPVKMQNASVNTHKKPDKANSNGQTELAEASQNPRGLSEEELDDIRLARKNICFPSKIRILEIQKQEILREIQIDSGLSGEAVRDLLVLHGTLAEFEGLSNELTVGDKCPEGTKPATAIVSSNYQQNPTNLNLQKSLVSVNNKTSIFSAVTKATPEFFEKLASVLTLLQEQEGYQLKISGDNEAEYKNEDNINLSSRPEEESESYLQIMVDLKF